MANSNTFRFTLSHASLGSIVISEPDGWKDAKLKMERHPEYHSLVEYFEGSFIFYGENNVDNGGLDFILQCENLYGSDAEISIVIQADIDGDGVYEETIFTGQLDLPGLKQVHDNKIQVPIIREDFWAKFIARKDTPVNLRSTTDLDGNTVTPAEVVDVNLTSQKIKKSFAGYLKDTRTFDEGDLTTSDYIQLDVDVYTLDEIEEKFTLPIITNPEIPQSVIDVSEDGSYVFDLRVEVSVVYYDSVGTYPSCSIERSVRGSASYLDIYIQINDDAAIQFAEESSPLIFTDISTIYTYTGTLPLRKGDQIKIYGDVVANISALGDAGATLWLHSTNGIGQILVPIAVADVPSTSCTHLAATEPSNVVIAAPSLVEFPTYFNITAHTTYPNTSAQAFFVHDAIAQIVKLISGGTFKSEYLGSTVTNARQYAADGCAWKNIILTGLLLRGYTVDEKQFSISFDKAWKGASPLFNLGLGYTSVSNEIEIEDKADFFDATSISVRFENVREISREYDEAMMYNVIEAGFNKWQSEDISGLDDPQTKRSWATRLQKANKILQIISDWIAASIAIEVTRRKTIEKSEDYKYDNEVFVIAINGDGVSPDRYVPELDENFDAITGLENSDSRYNVIHTPLRMALRWGNVWNSCLQKYQSSSLKFVSGEGNYDMATNHTCTDDECLAVVCANISEKADINLSTYGGTFGYLHLPMLYTIEIINFTWDDYLLIRNNRKKAIGISQTIDNFKRFFIKDLTYDICKGKCKILAWPYDEAPIRAIETEMPDREEPEEEEVCPTFYVAEYLANLDNWTSEGGTDIPASTLETLANWDNGGIALTIGWVIDASPSVSLNSGVNSDYIRGEIDTVVGLTYSFDWEIVVGSADRTGQFKFMLLDASNNILDSDTVTFTDSTAAEVKSGTVNLSPIGSNGVYFAIQILHTTPINSTNFELQSATLSGGTGSLSTPLPSWEWVGNYGGSSKASITYEGYGVKNFVLDNVTAPQEAHTFEIGYAVPTNNTNLSLRFRILNSVGVELYDNIFASDVADSDQKTATFEITDSDVWTNASKFEISVFDMSTPENFENGDEVYITKVEISICADYLGVFDADYEAVLDYGTAQGYSLPSAAQKEIENQKLLDMKAQGIWDDLDLFYYFETDGDRDFAKINWKNPGTNNLTEVGTLTFTPGGGFTGNGVNAYLDTGWAPDPDAVHFTQDEGGVFCKLNTDTSSSNAIAFGCRGNAGHGFNGQTLLIPKDTTDSHTFAANCLATPVGTSVSSDGFYHIRRVSSADLRLFKNESQVGSIQAVASTSLTTRNLAILACNFFTGVGNYYDGQIGCFGIGASLTGKESALNTIFNT